MDGRCQVSCLVLSCLLFFKVVCGFAGFWIGRMPCPTAGCCRDFLGEGKGVVKM
ncbi:hypothetical protein DL95DRAFT_382420, partial [Leptodontidium sp. 2 PMI_412]